MSVPAAFNRDENFVPVTTLGFTSSKTITYVAGTTGAVGPTTLFTVTGVVAMQIFATVDGATDLTGSGTLEVGISGNTASLLGQVAATALDANEIWVDTGPATIEALPALYLNNGKNVIQTIGTDTVTAGTLTYYCVWIPISPNASVVAA